MKLIKREYLNQLKNYILTPDIKVISGIRRSGKSILLVQLKEYIISNFSDANIIDIDFNDFENDYLLDSKVLYKYIKERYQENKKNFLLIDEVQMCSNFERVINSLHKENKYDIYLTGSNAFLLSSDLATLFTGRSIEIKIYPFSFNEFLNYFDLNNPLKDFELFLNYGGMSGSYLYPLEESRNEYLRTIYNTIIERDLVKRKKIKNLPLLNNLSSFLLDNIGNLTSLRNVSNSLNTIYKSNHKTIASYVTFLKEAYLFFEVKRFDIKGKKYLNSSSKYYLYDHSFRHALLGRKNMDYGRIYENIVALELKRRNYEIYVGTLYKKEIDFVAIKQEEKMYIQVSYDISNEETFKREVEPLLKINDGYQKILICRINQPYYFYEGIKIIDIGEFLNQE